MHREILSIYLANLKEMMDELKSTLSKIAVKNTGEFITSLGLILIVISHYVVDSHFWGQS